jgi:chaperonin GroES
MKKSKTNLLDFELMYDYIMVKAIEVGASNGLAKPDQYDDKSEFGEVIKVGDGRLLEDGTVVPLKMKPGDIIYFGKYSSVLVRSEGEDYLIIRDDDVMAVRHEKSGKKVSN